MNISFLFHRDLLPELKNEVKPEDRCWCITCVLENAYRFSYMIPDKDRKYPFDSLQYVLDLA